MKQTLAPVVVACMAASALAGSLNPPAGPVAPTPGPEPRIAINATNTPGDADSIYKITAPGSYYLAGNVTGVAGKKGIEIGTSDVTIDLMGFEMQGVQGSLAGVGVSVASASGIEVRNGVVRGWGGEGIDLNTNSPSGLRVEAIRALGNTGAGIFVSTHAIVSNCVAQSNGSTGIRAEFSSNITGCSSSFNSVNGFASGGISNSFVSCMATGNINDGFSLTDRSEVAECTASGNAHDGISTSAEGIITGNLCAGNSGAGIRVLGADNRVESNNCLSNSIGLGLYSSGSFVAHNTCSGNTTYNYYSSGGNVMLGVNAGAGGLIAGNSGGAAPGSTDPNANFTY